MRVALFLGLVFIANQMGRGITGDNTTLVLYGLGWTAMMDVFGMIRRGV